MIFLNCLIKKTNVFIKIKYINVIHEKIKRLNGWAVKKVGGKVEPIFII